MTYTIENLVRRADIPAQPPLTVGMLIEILKGFPPELPVRGTWEGITPRIRGVEHFSGEAATVLIDVDN